MSGAETTIRQPSPDTLNSGVRQGRQAL